MDLWIRGQDRERLIKPTDFYIEANLNFYTAEPIDFDIYALNFANSDIKIGKYKTKERALEVLDEIQMHIKKQDTDELLVNSDGIITGQKHYGRIYEMPKE